MKMKPLLWLVAPLVIFTSAATFISAQASALSLDPASRFGLNLVKQLYNKEDNLFISPLSIHACLEMAYLGAGGTTASEISKTLNLSGIDAKQAAKNYSDIIANIKLTAPQTNCPTGNADGRGLICQMTNSIWAKPGILLRPTFVKTLNQSFDAEFKTQDFTKPGCVAAINNWVKTKTNGKIDSIVTSIEPSTLLMLLNSAYFKGRWQHEFDKSQTKAEDFHLLHGKKISVPMMKSGSHYQYYEDKNVQVVRLPYTDNSFAMYVFLPHEKAGITSFLETLDDSTWKNYRDKMTNRSGNLTLPRFKMTYDIKLKDILSKMGMTSAFSASSADFSKMLVPPSKAFIGDVIHKTFVDVNEEGTEAAAITAIQMMGAAAPGPPVTPFIMTVDHPFFFAVVYEPNFSASDSKNQQTILFAGLTLNPSAGQ